MERTFRKLTRSQLNEVLNVVCGLEKRIQDMTEEEKHAFEIGVQCIAQILNRMADDKPINWD